MKKRLFTSVALTLCTAVATLAAPPITSRIAELITPAPGQALEFGSQAALADAERINAEASQTLLELNNAIDPVELTFVDSPKNQLGEPAEKLTFSDSPVKAPAKKSSHRAGTIKTGELIEIDKSLTTSSTISAHTTLALVDAEDATQGYKLSNFYTIGADYGLTMTIDAEAGTVSIPRQAVYTHSTYGEVSFIKIIVSNGKRYISDDPVTGTIDENGNISIGSWGLLVTNQESSSYLGSFFIAESSRFMVPNASASCINASSDSELTYSMYIEQPTDNIVTISGFFQPGNIVLNGRIKSDKTLTIPQMTFYTNAYYGNFVGYSATWSNTSGTWKASIDTKNPMVFSPGVGNELTIPGWVVAAQSSPSSAVAYAYRDYTISYNEGAINWPAAPTVNFSGSGSQDDPYLIKSADDITALAQLVLEGNTFSGKYLALANDIDMSSVNSTTFMGIGDKTAPFDGTFDGQNHTVKNFTLVNKGFDYAGLFGYGDTNSVIKNLNVSALNAQSSGQYLGGIVAMTYGKVENCHVTSSTLTSTYSIVAGIAAISYGEIANCSFSGTITGAGTAGGILGQGTSDISDCYVTATITTNSYITSCYDCAGIAGVLQNGSMKNCWMTGSLNETYGRSSCGGLIGRCLSSKVENCFATPTISTLRSYTDSTGGGDNYSGGLTGYITNSTMTNCYSSSTILKSGTSNYCGGLVGYLAVAYVSSTAWDGTRISNVSDISNCYFSGYINSSSTRESKYLFGYTYYYDSWKGDDPEVLCFKNCTYDRQMARISEDTYGRYTSYYTNGLPEGYDADVWEAKTGYYPVLKNVGAGTQAQALSSVVLNLPDQQSIKKVKTQFSASTADGVTWSVYGASDNETTGLKQEGNTFTIKDIYSNEVVMAAASDNRSFKMYTIAVVPHLFDGDGTAESPYLIKSVSDFVTLDSAVSTSGQSHAGDFFAMTGDIDCAKVTNDTETIDFQGVGGGGIEFAGTFDGRGYSIKNLTINPLVLNDEGATVVNSSKSYVGLFGYLGEGGTVKNLVIDKSCDITLCNYSGVVVAYNAGTVDNCRNYAAVKCVSTNNGGIVGLNAGTISNCYNAGRISAGAQFMGGISGQNAGTISMCQNDADVVAESNDPVNANYTPNAIGGISGYSAGTIEFCVNNGAISAPHSVGGIAGRVATVTANGCLNNGIVTATTNTTYRGAIFGQQTSIKSVTNCYYDSSINLNGASNNADITGATGMSSSELTAGVCPTDLAALGAQEVYDFTANAYPVLKQYANEDMTKALRTMYVSFAPSQVRNNILVSTPLSPATDVQWALETNENFKLDGKTLTVTVPEGMTVASDVLTATNGSLAKTYDLSSMPVIFSGEGTTTSPYLIETKEDWNKLADFMESSKWEYNGSYFRVTKDIDFEGDSIRVIAHDGVNFNGTLDGANHTVKGYVYANANSLTTKLAGPNRYVGKYIGVFGTIGSAGTVKNINFNGNFVGVSYIGGVCGYLYGNLENVKHQGTISNSSSSYCAGMVCRVYNGGKMTDCVHEGTVTSKTTICSGIASETQAGTLLTRCFNRGTVQATSSTASGLVYKLSGGLVDSGNEGTVTGTSAISGLVNTVDSTAYVERCYNKVDLGDTAKSTIMGLFNSFTTRYNSKAPGNPDGGYVIDCYNTGNISAKDYGYGFANAIAAGWTITNCYNTGNVTSLGMATGFARSATGGSADDLYRVKIDHCYNTGNITGAKAAIGGLISTSSYWTDLLYCYNTGNITNTITSSSNCTGGLVGQLNGHMDHCYNTGNIVSGTYAVGGLVGYVSYGKSDYPGQITNSFNLGDVTSTSTAKSANGEAGGLAGYIATGSADFAVTIDGCFNAGNVTAPMRAGGLAGGSFSPYHVIKNSYNSGRVTTTTAVDGEYRISGTVYTNDESKTVDNKAIYYMDNCINLHYDKTVFTGKEYRTASGSAKTTGELQKLEISDAFELSDGYPVLKEFDNSANRAGSIMILLTDESAENHDLVTDPVTLIAPAGTTWQVYEAGDNNALVASTKMTIDGSTATPVEKGDVTLVATTPENYCRTFVLSLAPSATGTDSLNATGSEIESVTYVDLQGRIVAQPTRGNVYIVRTNYTDGTSTVAKKVAK